MGEGRGGEGRGGEGRGGEGRGEGRGGEGEGEWIEELPSVPPLLAGEAYARQHW